MDEKTKKELLDLADTISSGLFATRESVGEALHYALKLANASSDSAAILTATYVVTNTIADAIRKMVADTKVEDVEKALESCRHGDGGWETADHPNALEALRWWMAYTTAEEIRESYTTKDMAYDLMDRVPAATIPCSIKEIADELWEKVDGDQNAWKETLENLCKFYTA